MAQNNNTSDANSDTFDKSLNEDIRNFHAGPNQWTQARNAINNSKTGDLGALGNEPATLKCITLPPGFTVISTIHIVDDRWLIYSTNMPSSIQIPQVSLGSEIGIFDASLCKYTKLVNHICLNFSTLYPITGVTSKTSLCTYKAYWDDQGYNPDRVMEFNIDDLSLNDALDSNGNYNTHTTIPYILECKDENGVVTNDPLNPVVAQGCITCTIPPGTDPALDCSKIRLARYIHTPCIQVRKGIGSGSLPNGSYMVAISYSIKGQKVGDWYISNVQSLFSHDNVSGSLDIELTDQDITFDDITVVIVSVVNQQTQAKQVGVYSTHQQLISIDSIQNTWVTVPIDSLVIRTPVTERSDAMYSVNDYLLRVGPRSKFDFNYQPLANQIVTKWVSTEFPENYYRNGGNRTGYMRDEIYSFFIRWIYDTGDKSSSYHIPGRPALALPDDLGAILGTYLPNVDGPLGHVNWITSNTGTQIGGTLPNPAPNNNGFDIAEGYMGYWESSEQYPDNKPEIWDASANPWSTVNAPIYGGLQGPLDYDLCGKKIRHHKMPDQTVSPALDYYNNTNQTIRVLGTKFENIRTPMMDDPITGLPIPVPGIIGYEILRGSRNGNRTIVAKGIINNMMKYQTQYENPIAPGQYLPDNFPTERLYQNYPYNDLRKDPFLSEVQILPVNGGAMSLLNLTGLVPDLYGSNSYGLGGSNNVKQDIFSFHSPDTNFVHPFLSAPEIKLYSEVTGSVTGKFEKSEKHPKEVLITNTALIVAAIAGIGMGALAVNGKRSVKYIPGGSRGFSQSGWKDFDFKLNQTYTDGTQTYGTSVTPTTIIQGTSTNTVSGSDSDGTTPGNNALEQPNYESQQWITNALNEIYNKITALENAHGETLFKNTDPTVIGGGLLNPIGDGTTVATYKKLLQEFKDIADKSFALQTPTAEITQDDGITKSMPSFAGIFTKLPIFLHYLTEGADNTLRLMRAYIKDSDFALRYHSHCFYNKANAVQAGNDRREILQSSYVGPQVTQFGANHTINNLYRNSFVAVEVNSIIFDPVTDDVTRIAASDVDKLWSPSILSPGKVALVKPEDKSFDTNDNYGSYNNSMNNLPSSGIQISSCHYSALKQNIRNLYGQLIQIAQQPASECVESYDTSLPTQTSRTTFGGDIYVGRYTEKNTFYFFTDWLYDQPDGAQFNYPANSMIAYPRFWANFDKFETTDFTSSLIGTLTNPVNLVSTGIITPSSYYNLDGIPYPQLPPLISGFGAFSIKSRWFYLFNSGVRDFYCESEINLDLRDWGNVTEERHYDPFQYTDTKSMFDTKLIKFQNFYKYDFSLSISKLFSNYISWGNMQSRYYDPLLAQSCFQYTPNRVIYSLPAVYGSYADNWLTYLPNNYKDFANKITAIYSINKSGAMIFFDAASPVQFQGLDQLQTDLGVKLTIGDGGLFSQPMQAMVNADNSYEYGSCQSRMSIINTPAGIFWMCQNQGKIFTVTGGINEISAQDLRWWLAQYLPFRLLQAYPDFELYDNTISGVGCLSIYDNENALLYFTKRDFQLRPGFVTSNPGQGETQIDYVSGNIFEVAGGTPRFFLGDPTYFEDVSWTISYDPKTQGWIGYHDWHPNLVLPGKNTFMSISNIASNPLENNSIWIHNKRTDLYCNYYGFNYPFEVEFMVQTGQQINTLRSVQYQLECYKYDQNQYDRFHKLDMNFDTAVIYNTEQCSGLLKLLLQPKNNLALELTYPIIQPVAPGWIEILFTKEENAYRFNQFWDTTADRGEFNPIAERMIWNTQNNGYVRELNDNNLDYNKNPFQRKKFRHYQTVVLLSKLVPEIAGTPGMEYKMLVNITDVKFLKSSR